MTSGDILLVKTPDEWLTAIDAVTNDAFLRGALLRTAQAMVADFDWERLGASLYRSTADGVSASPAASRK